MKSPFYFLKANLFCFSRRTLPFSLKYRGAFHMKQQLSPGSQLTVNYYYTKTLFELFVFQSFFWRYKQLLSTFLKECLSGINSAYKWLKIRITSNWKPNGCHLLNNSHSNHLIKKLHSKASLRANVSADRVFLNTLFNLFDFHVILEYLSIP